MKTIALGIVASLLVIGACSSESDDGNAGGTGGSGATGGSSGGGGAAGGGATANNIPPDNSADSIKAFIAAKGFSGSGWTPETSAPRDPSSVVSPHGRVRVYINDQAAAAQKGVSNPLDVEYSAGAMAVKEMVDDSDAVVGYAVMFKNTDGSSADTWTYWCYAPDDRCSVAAASPDEAVYGSPESDCSVCHGNAIFTLLP